MLFSLWFITKESFTFLGPVFLVLQLQTSINDKAKAAPFLTERRFAGLYDQTIKNLLTLNSLLSLW